MHKIILYITFCFLSIGVNLIFQWPFFHIFKGEWVPYVSLLVGTLAGLFIKYYCDKQWIFCIPASNSCNNFSCFALYAFMGGLTTIIFWGTELIFYYMFNFPGHQYVGGALGLLTGYLLKYQLDKKFVFKEVM
jgi:putative flippase GtrA